MAAEVTRADVQDLRRLLLTILAQTQRTSGDVGSLMSDTSALVSAVAALTENQTAITALIETMLEGQSTQEEQLAELKTIRENLELIVGEL